ncbi:Isochorismatase-like protein, partial [Clohesyomyces aquaticus]
KKLGIGSHPAIILLDVCKAYTSVESPIAFSNTVIEPAILAIAKLLNAARQPLPVVYAQTCYTHPSLRDAGLAAKKVPHISCFLEGHAQGLTAVPDPNGLAEDKNPSPFFGTNLAAQLTALGVDTVFIVAFTTGYSVRATTIDAMQCGFRPIVVGEGCADSGRETHFANLMDLNAKYADVI